MAIRITRVYTRRGDRGETDLVGGERAAKDTARIEAYGTVDEANSAIGVILAVPNLPAAVSDALTQIQHELFDLGGELAVPGYRAIQDSHIDQLEQCLDRFNEPLPPLKEFILPGGGPAAAACHVARAIARRAERNAWALAQSEDVAPQVTRYLNRLSDLLFVVARVLARHENGQEVLWKRK